MDSSIKLPFSGANSLKKEYFAVKFKPLEISKSKKGEYSKYFMLLVRSESLFNRLSSLSDILNSNCRTQFDAKESCRIGTSDCTGNYECNVPVIASGKGYINQIRIDASVGDRGTVRIVPDEIAPTVTTTTLPFQTDVIDSPVDIPQGGNPLDNDNLFYIILGVFIIIIIGVVYWLIR